MDADPDTDYMVVRQGLISAVHLDMRVLGQAFEH